MGTQKIFVIILTSFTVNLVQTSASQLCLVNDCNDDEDQKILSRHKRNFGGSEAIDYAKAIGGVFGPAGLVVHGCEAFSDIIFHLTGYTVLGAVYNFNERKVNPDKVRQKYLDQFFGPTAVASSAFRALRNPLFAFSLRFWLDIGIHTKNTTDFMQTVHVATIRDTILSEPWLHAKIFRDSCSLFFTSIGWTTYYLVWRYSTNRMTIMGKKKRSVDEEDSLKALESLFDKTYENVAKRVQEQEQKKLDPLSFESGDISDYFLQALNMTGASPDPRLLGDYQYFLSFGGDQYFDLPQVIDSSYGTRGLIVQVGHFSSQVPFELTGYTALGFMYNTFYRTSIKDQEVRKFLDTFVGPTTSATSMMRIARNGAFSLSLRIILGLFLPLTRLRTIFLLQTLTFTILKNTIFSELYLHQRLFRHIFENGCGIIGLSTYYAVFRYRKALAGPTPPPATTTAAPPKANSTEASAKKPAFNRNDFFTPGNSLATPYDTYSGYSYERPQYYNDEADNDEPYLDPQVLNSFKNVLAKLNTVGSKESSWSPVSSYNY